MLVYFREGIGMVARVAEVIIFLVLMVWWLEQPDSEYEFLDYFAGKARLCLMANAAGIPAEAYDLEYGAARARRTGKRSSMDLNSNAGLMYLDSLNKLSLQTAGVLDC